MVGREGGAVRVSVERHSDGVTLNRVAREATSPPARVNSGEWGGCGRLAEVGCSRPSVCHAAGEWARDDDGDGWREVHVNTQEGLGTGPRDSLRTYRGVSKKYLFRHVAHFEWGDNLKRMTPQFIRAVLRQDGGPGQEPGAQANTIRCNRLMDGAIGTLSLAVDLPNGGRLSRKRSNRR